MKITVFTGLPEFFDSVINVSILQRAIKDKVWQFKAVDLKQYGTKTTGRIDDKVYGGGSGMLLRADVIERCFNENFNENEIEDAKQNMRRKIIVTSPRGKKFNQKMAEDMANNYDEIFILASRFEGVDQRAIDFYNMEEVSIGDYVLLGGEVAATVMIESVVRLLDGAIANDEATREESFSDSLCGGLEYDQYTRPAVWQGINVPHVLTNGNHAQIQKWKMQDSRRKTESAAQQAQGLSEYISQQDVEQFAIGEDLFAQDMNEQKAKVLYSTAQNKTERNDMSTDYSLRSDDLQSKVAKSKVAKSMAVRGAMLESGASQNALLEKVLPTNVGQKKMAIQSVKPKDVMLKSNAHDDKAEKLND